MPLYRTLAYGRRNWELNLSGCEGSRCENHSKCSLWTVHWLLFLSATRETLCRELRLDLLPISWFISHCRWLKSLSFGINFIIGNKRMSENAGAEFRKTFIQCSENLEVLILRIYHSNVLFWGPIGFPILRKFTILLSYKLYQASTTKVNAPNSFHSVYKLRPTLQHT
jgi:hypothetical protein